MKKIPTLFKREFKDHKVVKVTNEVTKGMEWVLAGEGVATVKVDGSCCAFIGGKRYKRYDAKRGKTPPDGAIPCQDSPDPVTGHWPHWVEIDESNPADKWFVAAFDKFDECNELQERTYEAVGKHFNGNPYGFSYDTLEPHGIEFVPDVERSFDGIRSFLERNEVEGIVFWKDGEPKCKIKRTDFGFKWPVRRHE